MVIDDYVNFGAAKLLRDKDFKAEVLYSPKWRAGDTVASIANMNLAYDIQSIVATDDGRQGYCVELFDGGQSCGAKFIDCRKMDSWSILLFREEWNNNSEGALARARQSNTPNVYARRSYSCACSSGAWTSSSRPTN